MDDHRMHVAAAFIAGVVLAYLVFSFSVGGLYHNKINVPKVLLNPSTPLIMPSSLNPIVGSSAHPPPPGAVVKYRLPCLLEERLSGAMKN